MMSNQMVLSVLPDGNGEFRPCPELMTEKEVIQYLRIPEISSANKMKNVIDNLVRMHKLPCIHISRKRLYPLEGVRNWVNRKLKEEMAAMGKKL